MFFRLISGFHRNLIKTILQYHAQNVKTHTGTGPKKQRNKDVDELFLF
jgi:hypothetical protein